MRYIKCLCDWVRHHWTVRRVAIALLVALACIVTDYFTSNLSYPIFHSASYQHAFLGKLKQQLSGKHDDVILINVGFDKQLVPVVDPVFLDTIGYRAITDRVKLLRFLEIADSCNYRYLFIDIKFVKGDNTPEDSALFAHLKRMPRMSIATHRAYDGYEIADSSLLSCAGFCDYRFKSFEMFSHYEILQDEQPSVALRMYRSMDKGDVCHHGPFYTSGGRLSYNSIFLPLTDIHSASTGEDDESFEQITRLEMGFNILGLMFPEDVRLLFKDKILLVGDFDNDVHDTYIGSVAGSLLNYYAYREMQQGHHFVNPLFILCQFLLFVFVGMGILRIPGHAGSRYLEKHPRLKVLIGIILSSVKVTSAIAVATVIFYLAWGISMSTTLPLIVYNILAMCIEYFNTSES